MALVDNVWLLDGWLPYLVTLGPLDLVALIYRDFTFPSLPLNRDYYHIWKMMDTYICRDIKTSTCTLKRNK